MIPEDCLLKDQFPLSNAYHPDWVIANASGGANSMWLTEWLASALELKPGMNVLDLGCGCSSSSIFLAREYGVTVWATDLWCSASDNLLRIRDAGLEGKVYPIHADARSLPFAANFFDAIVSIDSFFYFGTDDHYLSYVARFVKPNGLIAIAQAGLIQEIEGSLPEHMQRWWASEPSMWCLHSSAWWRRHWERTGIVEIERADSMPDGWQLWLKWHREVAPNNLVEISAVQSDGGKHLGYNRIIGRRRAEVTLNERISSVPSSYVRKPLLRACP